MKALCLEAPKNWKRIEIPMRRSDAANYLGLSLESVTALLILAAIANIFYCAAYIADIPMQYSQMRATWLRWRWCVWLGGTLFALLLTNYWIADEIYPYVTAPHFSP